MQRGERATPPYWMRKSGLRISIVLAAFIGFLTVVTSAHAQDRWGGSLAVTSDYVYRGVSLSRGQVAYQGGAHLRLPSQWQVGVWGSTIETRDNDGSPFEANFIVSHAWILGSNWDLRAGYTRYQYFGLPDYLDYDHDEVFATASFQSRLTLGLNYSPNIVRYRYQQAEEHGAATAVDATWQQPLIGDWSATAGVGYYDLSALYDTGYAYWHLGVAGAIGPIELDVLFIDTASEAAQIYGESITEQRWSATARWRF